MERAGDALSDPEASLQAKSSVFRPNTSLLRICDVASFTSTATLFALSVADVVALAPHMARSDGQLLLLAFYVLQTVAYGYTSCLTGRALVQASKWTYATSIQRTVILLVVWSIYAYRDLWPLATFTLAPADTAEGPTLWVKITLLTLAAVLLPLVSPRLLPGVPRWDTTPRPEETASVWSLISYSWLNPLISYAQRVSHVRVEEMPPLAENNTVENLVDKSYEYLDPLRHAAQSKGAKSIVWGLIRLFRWDYAIMSAMVILASFASFLVPLGLKHILGYVEHGAEHEELRPWFWIAALFLGSTTVSMAMQFYHYVSTLVVARTQAVMTQLMYDHSLRMRAKSSQKKTPKDVATASPPRPGANGVADPPKKNPKGDMPAINNLVTSDLRTVTNSGTFPLLVLFETPIQVVGSIYFLYGILGWSTFVGIAVLAILNPIPGRINDMTRVYEKAKRAKGDQRVKLVEQMLKNIRTVKLQGWEHEQGDKIDAARKEELRCARKATLMLIWMELVKTSVPLVVMLATYATYTLAMHRQLSASIVFSSISLFEILRTQFANFLFRRPILTAGWVALERISRLLNESELLDQYNESTALTTSARTLPATDHIGFRDARYTWTSEQTADDGSDFSLNIEGEVFFEKRGVNLICGPTACGKTSLLMAVLGEMHGPLGENAFASVPAQTSVAFVPQEPWIVAGTVKDNILFGSPYDNARYRRTLYECALDKDIQGWLDGDDTAVGERGITLSGGQKARISLARAVYSSCEYVLIDDVLAALDNTTVQHIVRHCFQGQLLRGRTLLVVSNNVEALKVVSHRIVAMGSGGRVLSVRDQSEAERSEIARTFFKAVEDPIVPETAPVHSKKGALSPTTKAEEAKEGHVGWGPLTLLFGNMSARPVWYWLTLISALFASGAAVNAQYWLLGVWAEDYAKHPSADVPISWFLGIYTALLLGATLADFGARALHMEGSLRACAVIHKRLMDAILGTTLRWIETTPTGRIIARCTEDIGIIDNQVTTSLFTIVQLACLLTVRLLVVVLVAPVFSIGVALVAFFCVWLTRVYMRAQLPVKRAESITRAPLIGHLNTTIAGLVSIRAYKAQERFRREMFKRIDPWTRASNTFFNLNRWVVVRADMIGTLFTVSLAAYLVYVAKLDASNIGFSLSMAIGAMTKIFDFVRNFNAFEVAGNSLERIEQYLDIEKEADLMGSGDSSEGLHPDELSPLAQKWPQEGSLEVRNLRAAYSESAGTPEVLKGLTFTVKPGERIGIVGRTGSGKSTLMLALLRCILTNVPPNVQPRFRSEGSVVYAGRPIGGVDLATLRKSITIIAQNAELFAGTIRQNLDPFDRYGTEELEGALRSAQGLDDVASAPAAGAGAGGRLTLEREIKGEGDMSAGERQIIALARAIVRKSRLLIMDEATSSIDHESDGRIQKSLRAYLAREGGATVVTVAHRLQTIRDYDRVVSRRTVLVLHGTLSLTLGSERVHQMVLKDGEMVEFDTLANLLAEGRASEFRRLVDDAAKDEREAIYAAVGLTAPSY